MHKQRAKGERHNILPRRESTAGANPAFGFTLIEALVAISLLMTAVIAPMSLTTRSLSTAYYARDQITAFHLAQEAIESIRHVRDGNILSNALGTTVDLLQGIPSMNGDAFTVDTLDDGMSLCPEECPPLNSNGELYGYESGSGWAPTRFTRSVRATFVEGNIDEARITVTVVWQTGPYLTRSFTIYENLFRWVNDGSAAP